MPKQKYNYKKMDYFYDVESLTNAFTSVEFYPALNTAIISYIDDDNFIKTNEAKEFIEQFVRIKIPAFTGHIVWEDLTLNGDSTPGVAFGLRAFAKRRGLATNQTMLNVTLDARGNDSAGFPASYYPVKQTDPDYKPDEHGISFGYNSTNYDLTMYAHLFDEIEPSYFHKTNLNPAEKNNVVPTAAALRQFNDELFDPSYIKNMPSRLAVKIDHKKKAQQSWSTNMRQMNNVGKGTDYKSKGWSLRKAWLLTNRFIDVARLNEKQSRVALKRLLGMLGLPIIESDKLSNDTVIHSLEEMAELIAYNISDVINLQTLFEHEAYLQPYVLRNQLLEEYPEAVYQKQNGSGPENYKAYDKEDKYLHVRKDRLTSDSTSAKFVEYVIAPYNQLTDQPVVSFMYPAPSVCEKLSAERGIEIKPTDVLEDSKQWFEENVAPQGTPAHDEFMQIYNFYDEIRGKNMNASEKYQMDYGDQPDITTIDNSHIRELMGKYNTNLFYFDENGERTASLANFSIGGIHGAEIKLDKYLDDLATYNAAMDKQQQIQDMFDNDALAAINGDATITTPWGTEEKIRSFMKSGSTRKKATWKVIKKPELFKKAANAQSYKIDKKYTYVSIGEANHEDFTSYYPLLLCQLAVFLNPERGDNADPYYGIFERRVDMKHKAHDKSLPETERNMADLIQTLMKLLLNAASGAADATFDNNIRVNNAIVSMRIIGQLFAWRIGQAQALAGARVPSTNTDGLYTMNIDTETNNKILFDIADDMYIGIEPEPLDRFVTKDSNNRLEVYKGKIVSAKGGTLNSWHGPYPTQNLDHPAAIDNVLANYLAFTDDPANRQFDRNKASQLFAKIIDEYGVQQNNPQEALRYFQWILASATSTNRYVYVEEVNEITGESTIKNLQHYNRIFLTTPAGNTRVTPYLATRATIPPATVKRREKNNETVRCHDKNAKIILAENGYDVDNSDIYYDEARTVKVKSMPDNQHIDIVNESLVDMSPEQAWNLIKRLDVNAYLSIVETTFNNSWSNLDNKNKAA